MTTTYTRKTHRGAPMLDAAPFHAWLRARNLEKTQIADALGIHESRVRRWLESPRVCERTVERAGLALADDPRLAAQLYPELDF